MMSNLITSLMMFATLVVPSAFKNANNMPVRAASHPTTKTAEVGSGSQELRLMNVQDYIYVNDPENGYNEPDLVDQFKEYAKKRGYENVTVNYKTTDTPESMFNEVKLAPNNFDLICPSDYMIQKLVVNDMIMPMDIEGSIPNYVNNASPYIKNLLDSIEVYDNEGKPMLDEAGNPLKLEKYAVGYMWGTLGLLFDPAYNGRDPEKTVEDMQSWSVLWDPDYKGIATVKDSVRDTYAIGLLHAYDKEFKALQEQYDLSNPDNYEAYNKDFSELFNQCDEEALKKVYESLDSLKGNVFGMEVDSGKQDIVTGKIGINFAWSGDAVYSMEQAETEGNNGDGLELYYSIPETGSNIWMDAWCMPKGERSEAQTELAYLFLDFLSDPEYTAKNMDFTGYTPFIGGPEILELTREWYDYRYLDTSEMEAEEKAIYEADFDEEGNLTPDAIKSKLQKVDLSYFFKDTLDEVDENGDPVYTEDDYIFYSDSYFVNAEKSDDGTITGGNRSVGGAFFTQFPDEYTLVRCAVMRDFGSQNDAVLEMWEKFKSNALPVWAVVLFVVEIVAAATLVGYFYIGNRVKHNLRKKRKEEQNKK